MSDAFAISVLLCPVCETRPRKIGKGAHGQRGPLKTCGHAECVAALRAQSNRVQLEDVSLGERQFPATMRAKDGPTICPHCEPPHAKWFGSLDGVAWEGCDGCGWQAPIPIIRNGALADPQPAVQLCGLCRRAKPIAEFAGQWCRRCTQNRLRQLRVAAKRGGRPPTRRNP